MDFMEIKNIREIINKDLPIMSQRKIEECFTKNQILYNLKDCSGIYGIFLRNECVYIGESRSLLQRIMRHMARFNSPKSKLTEGSDLKYKLLQKYKKDIVIRILTFTPKRRKIIEKQYIAAYNPIFNIETPSGRKHFVGTESDIEDFMYGLQTMDDLRLLAA